MRRFLLNTGAVVTVVWFVAHSSPRTDRRNTVASGALDGSSQTTSNFFGNWCFCDHAHVSLVKDHAIRVAQCTFN